MWVVAVEMWSARRAAETRSDEHLEELASILTRMDDPGIHVREYNALDARFHALIATASGNAIIQDLSGGLRSAVEQQMIEAYDQLEDWRDASISVRSEHRQILEALRDRDPELAAAVVRSHAMNFFRNALASAEDAPAGAAVPTA